MIGNWRLPLWIYLSGLFAALLVVAVGAIGVFNDRQDRRLAQIAVDAFSRPTLEAVAAEIGQIFESAARMADILAASRFADDPEEEGRLRALPMIVRAFATLPDVSSIYVGHEDGSFLSVIDLDRLAPLPVTPPPEARYAARAIAANDAVTVVERWRYYDERLDRLGGVFERSVSYDPRQRPWFNVPGADTAPRLTRPYRFNTGGLGATAVRRNPAARVVLGIDLRLGQISTVLAHLKPTPNSELALVDAEGRVMGSSRGLTPDLALQPLRQTSLPGIAALEDRGQGVVDVVAGGRAWKALLQSVVDIGGQRIDIALAVPVAELIHALEESRTEANRVTLLVAILAIAVLVGLARLASLRLSRLERGARQVQALDFTADFSLNSNVTEVARLAETLGAMQATIRRLLEIGRALAEERDMEQLHARLLQEAVGASGAAIGVLVLADRHSGDLVAVAAADRRGAVPVPEAFSAMLATGPAWLTELMRHGRACLRDGDSPLDAGSRRGASAVAPLRGHDGAALGAVYLRLPADWKRSPGLLPFVDALCAFSAIALENSGLIQAQKDLLDGIIRVLASAIDAKSAYTGAHCQRVPELTMAIAEAAQHSARPSLARYGLSGRERDELRLAAWLHDCGKITTPEWVVDKSTRLECVHNRIHEIRTRFEVLWRDAEIAALRSDDEHAGEACRARQQLLLEDFRFVAECNLGGTIMDADRLARLRAIAAREWERHFDDGLGLSAEERQRHRGAALPAVETLISDKPMHLIPQVGIVPDYLSSGFSKAAPAHSFNQGELYNLSIRQGTLTSEERFKIQEHVMQTILMLRRLPLPASLQRIPEIAGAHHEQLNGHGYPVGLQAKDLSISQRILAVADVFEALTARDRPYKTGKTISQALTILGDMAEKGHLDGDIVALLEEGGIAAAYAGRHGIPLGEASDLVLS